MTFEVPATPGTYEYVCRPHRADDERHAEGRLTLRATLSTPDGKRRYVRRLFATIADRYDFITRFLSYGQDRRWKQRLVRLAASRPHDRVLDLACGTGDILFSAAPRAKSAVGLDVTHRMLQLAKAREAPHAVRPPAPQANRWRRPAPGLVVRRHDGAASARRDLRRRDDRIRAEERARPRGRGRRDPPRARRRRTAAVARLQPAG